MWLAITTVGLLVVGVIYRALRRKGRNQQSRWAWWREYHERMRRYPTPEEVDDWMSEQRGPTAP